MNHIFQLGDDGVLRAVNTRTGQLFWQVRLGRLSASAPAVGGQHRVCDRARRRKRRLPGPHRRPQLRERGDPLVAQPSEPERVFAHGRPWQGVLRVTERDRLRPQRPDRADLWTYQAAGAVKASPTLAGGVLYFGDYSGHVQAISEQTGRRLWVSGSEGALLGSGTFYSTAAAVYGRIFLGNTDGRVYAYDAATGKLDWAVQTGAYVYASPAVTNAPGLGPTVYLGSYSGTFYALNARTGAIAWQFDAHGRISGSATIVGRTVYFADLGDHRTYGLGISTGRVLFEQDTGAFDAVISDGTNIYLTGTTGLYDLVPTD